MVLNMKETATAAIAILIASASIQIAQTKPEPTRVQQTEHGWRTTNVVATRYTNQTVGYNIGFKFPNDPGNSDRVELLEFIEGIHRGSVYSGGGYPGAEVFVVFSDVTDRETADKKLKVLLPLLDDKIVSLRKKTGQHP